jgi:hypothetical protein
MYPTAPPEQISAEIVLVQPLLDNDDRALGRIIETRCNHSIVSLMDSFAFRGRAGVLCSKRVIDHDHIKTTTGDSSIEGGGVPTTSYRRFEVHGTGPIGRETRTRKDLIVPIRDDKAVRFDGKIPRQRLAMGDYCDPQPRVATEQPGRECDRGED